MRSPGCDLFAAADQASALQLKPSPTDRGELIAALADRTPWEVIIIGGGATGLGCAVDASARGYRTLLLEQSDFAKGTSSRSTKLIHGGVRYLQQGNLKLVRGALRERGLLMKNAPHLVRSLPFVIPCFAWWDALYYGTGLKMYDVLAGKFGIGRTEHLSRAEVVRRVPNIKTASLRGGIVYHDGQFDDARLAVGLLQTALKLGATALNYCPVVAMVKTGGKTRGVIARDAESGREFEVHGKSVINCSGVFTDVVRKMDEPQCERMIVTSQGAHVVLDREFLAGDTALMVPKTKDGRVLFAIPWNGKTLIGTTDTAVNGPTLEPRPLKEEIAFILEHAATYLAKAPGVGDIRSTFAGLRPLVKRAKAERTALVPRDHTIVVSPSGLLTVTGGKWTTYRKMAEETLDIAERAGELGQRASRTADLPLAIAPKESGNERLHPALPYTAADVITAVRHEMARTVEDVLARRTRALFLDAKASLQMAPMVATMLARELGCDAAWQAVQVKSYTDLARGYLPE